MEGRKEMGERDLKTEHGRRAKDIHRLRTALILLLVAFAVILVKEHEFWFGPGEAIESDASVPESVPQADSSTAPAKTTAPSKKQPARKTSIEPAIPAPSHNDSANPEPPAVATNRTALPPLDVEVVAGDTHRIIRPGSNVAKVEIPGDSNRAPAVSTVEALPANAGEREHISAESVPELHQTIDATYPLLGQHMRVQGSVVLQALVGTDGSIEDLRVISGPAILSTAAQQAVLQWRFKPYFQNGHPVETKARITVNFSIRVSDNAPKTS